MWNVFLIDNETCKQVNSQPYDVEQISELLALLEQLDEPAGALLITSAIVDCPDNQRVSNDPS